MKHVLQDLADTIRCARLVQVKAHSTQTTHQRFGFCNPTYERTQCTITNFLALTTDARYSKLCNCTRHLQYCHSFHGL